MNVVRRVKLIQYESMKREFSFISIQIYFIDVIARLNVIVSINHTQSLKILHPSYSFTFGAALELLQQNLTVHGAAKSSFFLNSRNALRSTLRTHPLPSDTDSCCLVVELVELVV